jgi:hypothetical protein
VPIQSKELKNKTPVHGKTFFSAEFLRVTKIPSHNIIKYNFKYLSHMSGNRYQLLYIDRHPSRGSLVKHGEKESFLRIDNLSESVFPMGRRPEARSLDPQEV